MYIYICVCVYVCISGWLSESKVYIQIQWRSSCSLLTLPFEGYIMGYVPLSDQSIVRPTHIFSLPFVAPALTILTGCYIDEFHRSLQPTSGSDSLGPSSYFRRGPGTTKAVNHHPILWCPVSPLIWYDQISTWRREAKKKWKNDQIEPKTWWSYVLYCIIASCGAVSLHHQSSSHIFPPPWPSLLWASGRCPHALHGGAGSPCTKGSSDQGHLGIPQGSLFQPGLEKSPEPILVLVACSGFLPMIGYDCISNFRMESSNWDPEDHFTTGMAWQGMVWSLVGLEHVATFKRSWQISQVACTTSCKRKAKKNKRSSRRPSSPPSSED